MSKRGHESTRRGIRTICAFALISALCVLVDNVYALFGHGVRSAYMTYMFLYPLIGGAGFNALRLLAAPQIAYAGLYRLGANLYNAGLAALTVAALAKGILEIAGSSSPYILHLDIAGGAFVAVGFSTLIIAIAKNKKTRLSPSLPSL